MFKVYALTTGLLPHKFWTDFHRHVPPHILSPLYYKYNPVS